MKRNIELHIEELALQGFGHVDSNRIGAAVVCELTRLLTEQGIGPSLTRSGRFQQMNGAAFQVAPNSNAEIIGAQVAQSVYRGFTK